MHKLQSVTPHTSRLWLNNCGCSAASPTIKTTKLCPEHGTVITSSLRSNLWWTLANVEDNSVDCHRKRVICCRNVMKSSSPGKVNTKYLWNVSQHLDIQIPNRISSIVMSNKAACGLWPCSCRACACAAPGYGHWSIGHWQLGCQWIVSTLYRQVGM